MCVCVSVHVCLCVGLGLGLHVPFLAYLPAWQSFSPSLLTSLSKVFCSSRLCFTLLLIMILSLLSPTSNFFLSTFFFSFNRALYSYNVLSIRSWRVHFSRTVAMKFNCFFLMPFLDDFPTYLVTFIASSYHFLRALLLYQLLAKTKFIVFSTSTSKIHISVSIIYRFEFPVS